MSKLSLKANDVIKEINEIIAKINTLKSSSNSMSAATKSNFVALEQNVKRLKGQVANLGQQLNYLKAALNSTTTAQNKATAATNKATAATNKAATAKKKLTKSSNGFNASVGNLLKAGGIYQLVGRLKELAYNVYENIKTFDSLSFTLEKITKTNFDYENSQQFLLRITKAYGVELVQTTVRWSRFLAAAKESGLALKDTEDIFESMTKASATLGLGTDELSSVYLALEQMLSKGKVTTEELRRQLGERLPGAMGIMAASMGVTIPVLDKMLKKGEVLSAEVLPNFAKAVERAYGIENADRIDTLVSKQNRLTAAWQTFIKNISEGDSVIKNVIGWFIQSLEDAATFWTAIFADEKQEIRLAVAIEEGDFEKGIRDSFKRVVDMTSDTSEQESALARRQKILQEQLKTAIGEEVDIIQEGLDKILRIRLEKDKQAEILLKEAAKQRLEDSYNEFVKAQAKYDSLILEKDNKKKDLVAQGKTGASWFVEDSKELESARASLIKYQAQYNLFRKLVQESNVQVVPDADDGDKAKVQKILRQLKDYYLQNANAIAKISLESNKNIIEDVKANLEDRLKAITEAAKYEIYIRRNQYKIEQQDIDNRYIKEAATINKAVSTGNLSRVKADAFLKKLNDERNDHTLLKAKELTADLLEVNTKYAKQSETLTFTTNKKDGEDRTADRYNKEIIAANQAFLASSQNTAAREELEKRLAKITIEASNAMIDTKVNALKQEIDILESSGNANFEYVEKLKREINELNAGRQIQPPIDPRDWETMFEDSLDIAADFNDSISDLVGTVFDRKMEYINAEIEAEEAKYDKLIGLAEGDDQQQATLERNREERIQKLEKERLKAEQKQAKARKKFALADIAISTARAVIGIWADFPKADFGITAGIMSGVVAALGAVQAATVLATPIPQYKDGVENLSKNEVAMINDGGFKEYIERNGKILSSDKKNAIVDLKKGDTVYKNKEEMIKRSDLFKIRNNSFIQASKANQESGIKDEIKSGFKKVKINNSITVKNNQDSYRKAMSRW